MCTINLNYLILYILFPWFISCSVARKCNLPKKWQIPKNRTWLLLKHKIHPYQSYLNKVCVVLNKNNVMLDKCIVTFSPSMTYLLIYLRCNTMTYTFGPNSGRSAISWASSLFLSCWDCNISLQKVKSS